jgi:hypothetical protein
MGLDSAETVASPFVPHQQSQQNLTTRMGLSLVSALEKRRLQRLPPVILPCRRLVPKKLHRRLFL